MLWKVSREAEWKYRYVPRSLYTVALVLLRQVKVLDVPCSSYDRVGSSQGSGSLAAR
jgi:hypothetical protein